MKSRIGRRGVEWVARALAATEREAVLGDFAESGEPWNRALWDVVGLVARREVARWASVRPWLILVAVIAPLSLLISVLSRLTSGVTSVYFWMYANNSDWDLIRSTGFWYVLAGASLRILVQCLALVCWSWTVGFVVGAVSGKFVRSSTFVFLLMLLAGELIFAPRYLAFCWHLRSELFLLPALPVMNDPVSANFFYGLAFPLIVQIALVSAPALFGLLAATKLRAFHPLLRAGAWMAAILTVTTLLLREPGFSLLFYSHQLPWLNEPLYLLEFVGYWPIAYLLTAKIKERLSATVA